LNCERWRRDSNFYRVFYFGHARHEYNTVDIAGRGPPHRVHNIEDVVLDPVLDVEDLVRLEDFVCEVPDIESEARFTRRRGKGWMQVISRTTF